MTGCVERTLTLRSDPPGAKVVVNGDDVGVAPVKLHFDTYGVFEVAMSCPRHYRLRTKVDIRPPWYEKVPMDFFSEMVWPFEIRDERDMTLKLKPYDHGDEAGITQREQRLREQVERSEPVPPARAPEGKQP